jgi:trehalose 6-phosphate phosphatase
MMHDILAPEHVDVLAQLARSAALLAFDFDGTLAPIVADRDRAAMRDRTATLLTRLCALYPCAVISGRSQGDVAARLGGAPVHQVVGNHGLEPRAGMAAVAHDIRQALPLLERALGDCDGIDLEDKRFSLAVHYRRARPREEARATIGRAVAALPMRLRVIPGKWVANLLPAHGPDKGDALLALRALVHAEVALYIGDDATDEDVFRLRQPGRLVSVRVGESTDSSAAYFVRGQREVDALLTVLAVLREPRRRQ